jgi:hypothetical protein
MSTPRTRSLGAALVLSLAATACSSSNSTQAFNPPHTGATAIRFAGMGDSLTAGVQSNGLLGVSAPNPVPGSPSVFVPVPPTQQNGYWALVWQKMNNGADPSQVLPLIAAPGIGTVLVPNSQGAPTPITGACTGLNAKSYSFSTALQSRLNPHVAPFDLGIPGQTMHEAVYQYSPTGPCIPPPGPIGALAALLMEDDYFYPILGNFGPTVTQLQAAVALRPQITTVWLGSNDLLKFAFSGGQIGPTDPKQFAGDLTTIIRSLQKTGSKVAVANLVDVLHAAFFFPGPQIVAVITAKFVSLGLPPSVAATFANQLAKEILKESGVGPNGGYLTLQGLGKTFTAFQNGSPTIGLKPTGDFVTAALAVQMQNSNDALNSVIDGVTSANGAALVDIHATFHKIVQNGGIYPLNPKCCSLIYGGGFFSLDGIHPSNTGYAVLANAFIQTLDASFGYSIPFVDVSQAYATDPFAPH